MRAKNYRSNLRENFAKDALCGQETTDQILFFFHEDSKTGKMKLCFNALVHIANGHPSIRGLSKLVPEFFVYNK